MAKIRKFVAYRRLERPYTRISKYRSKSYIRTRPNSQIVRFDMGDLSKVFAAEFNLNSKSDLQIRHNAIESARLSANRLLEKQLGKGAYRLKIRLYPHHILRENPLAAGAGADRMSTGMSRSFGKVIGSAARVKKGQALLTVSVDLGKESVAKAALKQASYKFPTSCFTTQTK